MNPGNYNFVLNREQHELLIQIQQIKLRRVAQRQNIFDLEGQLRRLEDVQSQMQNINDSANEIVQHGNRQRQMIQTNFSLLCGSQIWPNLACCVAETVDGRNSETKVVVDRYKVMTDKLKESNAKRTAVCLQKELREKVADLMADMERFDEQIADERVETNEINLQNQRNNQFHEGMNRDWETRMREMKQELQRIEGIQQNQNQNDCSANAATTSAAIATAVPILTVPSSVSVISSHGQQMSNDDMDLTLSPVKIDEPVELLSSQLFVSSIREEIADTANEQANPPEQSSALSDLIHHPNIHQNDNQNRQPHSMQATTSHKFSEANLNEPTTTTPKRVPPKNHTPPAKKPCYSELVSTQAGSRDTSSESTRQQHRNDGRHNRDQSKSTNSTAEKPTIPNEIPPTPRIVDNQPMDVQKPSTSSSSKRNLLHAPPNKRLESGDGSMVMLGNRRQHTDSLSNISDRSNDRSIFGGFDGASNMSFGGFDSSRNSNTAPGNGNGKDSNKPDKSELSVVSNFDGFDDNDFFANDENAGASNFGNDSDDDFDVFKSGFGDGFE